MAYPKFILRSMPAIWVNGSSVDINLHVLTLRSRVVEHYELMCASLTEDIQSDDGPVFLEAIRRVEAGEVDKIEADGNAWVAHITRDKVWFEGLYSQGEGGEVSLAQYKLAVETYVRFLLTRQLNTDCTIISTWISKTPVH
jgi:hypothetical protein